MQKDSLLRFDFLVEKLKVKREQKNRKRERKEQEEKNWTKRVRRYFRTDIYALFLQKSDFMKIIT